MEGCWLVLLLLDWMQNSHPVQNQIQDAGPAGRGRAPWVSGSPDPARLSALQLRNHQCQIRVTRNHNIRSTFSK